MYASAKSCISYSNHTTGYFNCEIGVRQRENLSPFLFSMCLNDLEEFLPTKAKAFSKSINAQYNFFFFDFKI
jgi:hypothetical protein